MSDRKTLDSNQEEILQFGSFQLHPNGRLLKHGTPILISPKERDVLRLLIQANGQVVSKDEILQTVWQNEEVSESSLTRCIHFLRHHLSAGSPKREYIETVHGIGYRFKVTVKRIAVAEQLPSRLRNWQNPRLLRAAQTAPHVYEAYLEARYLFRRRTVERIKQAIELYQQAIEWDRHYAPAYVGLADCYATLISWSILPISQGKPLVEKALAQAETIDPGTPGLKVMQAMMKSSFEWKFAIAESIFQSIHISQTADGESLLFYARHLLASGLTEAAVDVMQTVVQLDPVSPLPYSFYAFILHFARHPEKSLEVARHAVSLEPDSPAPLSHLCMIAATAGLQHEALEVGQKLMTLAGWVPAVKANYAYTCARFGSPNEAKHFIAEALAEGEFPCRSFVIPVAAALGNGDLTAELLERSFCERCIWLPIIRLDPRLDPVRDHPQVATLLKQIGV